jgi:hypothetical protein
MHTAITVIIACGAARTSNEQLQAHAPICACRERTGRRGRSGAGLFGSGRYRWCSAGWELCDAPPTEHPAATPMPPSARAEEDENNDDQEEEDEDDEDAGGAAGRAAANSDDAGSDGGFCVLSDSDDTDGAGWDSDDSDDSDSGGGGHRVYVPRSFVASARAPVSPAAISLPGGRVAAGAAGPLLGAASGSGRTGARVRRARSGCHVVPARRAAAKRGGPAQPRAQAPPLRPLPQQQLGGLLGQRGNASRGGGGGGGAHH